GNHFMAFTAFCFKYLPLYNKFRTVSMALVVLQVALPVLGFMVLDGIVKEKYNKKDVRKALWWALGITGGFSLLCFLAPGLFGSFSGASDAQMQDVLVDALVKDRVALFRHDAFASLMLIAASSLLILWAYSPKGQTEHAKAFAGLGRKWIAAICISLLVLINMFSVGKRYLNADHFTTPKDFNKPFAERQVDKIILADDDPSYRVLDLTVNVFNSSVPSYHHKNIGGYSPAKLQRYQDLIEKYLSAEINGLYKAMGTAEKLDDVSTHMAAKTPVLNALNTRYVIVDDDFPPVVNDAAYGPAWFVTDYVTASTPDEEIALLGSVDLRTTAVLSQEIPDQVGDDGKGVIEMTSYAPNRLKYHYTAPSDALAVFSEIYYADGWHATVDGEPLELLRADWTLRTALLPAGEHDVEMYFLPDSYRTGAAVSRASSILLLLLLLGSIAGAIARKRSSAKKA
ncbi:MAG: YfhO family protein, partial [Bacteroidales bacterium]|nr:YfhO family protein [Bacteroidales bacterium]